MGIFDKVQQASMQHDANYIRAGRYILRLEEVRSGKGRKSEHWRWAAQVLAVLDNNEGKGHKIGEVVKRLRPSSQDGCLPEWKAFITTVLGCEESDITEATSNEITSDSQPMAGMVFEVHAQTVETKSSTPQKPVMFTRVNYTRRIPDDDVGAVIGAEAYAKFYAKAG